MSESGDEAAFFEGLVSQLRKVGEAMGTVGVATEGIVACGWKSWERKTSERRAMLRRRVCSVGSFWVGCELGVSNHQKT